MGLKKTFSGVTQAQLEIRDGPQWKPLVIAVAFLHTTFQVQKNRPNYHHQRLLSWLNFKRIPQNMNVQLKLDGKTKKTDFLEASHSKKYDFLFIFLLVFGQEGRKFGSLCSNIPYELSQVDFMSSVQLLQDHLNSKRGVNLSWRCYMLGHSDDGL